MPEPTDTVSGRSRRSFLRQASLGAAVVGVSSATPLLRPTKAAAATGPAPADARPPALDLPLVAYVRAASDGEIRLMVGDRQIVCHDPALVASLARATQSS